MGKYDRSAVHDFIDYLWSELQIEGLFNPADYMIGEYGLSVVPIIPSQDQPETANQLGNLPYIVYDYYAYPSTSKTDWWRNRDEVILSIYCPDINKIMAIGNFLKDKFQKIDESAADINAFVGPSNPYIFHCSEFIVFETYRPARSEGGRTVGEATISYEYVRVQPLEPYNILVQDTSKLTDSYSKSL